jgi:hypothetical protein
LVAGGLGQFLGFGWRISGQFAADEAINPAKTKTSKVAFSGELSASCSIRYEEDASETRCLARKKRIRKRSVKL